MCRVTRLRFAAPFALAALPIRRARKAISRGEGAIGRDRHPPGALRALANGTSGAISRTRGSRDHGMFGKSWCSLWYLQCNVMYNVM